MNVQVARRVFVGSVAAGMPLLLAGGSRIGTAAEAGPPSTALDRPMGSPEALKSPGRPPDPVGDQVARELDRLAREASRPTRGTWPQAAATLRLAAAWGEARNLDAAVRHLIERRGARGLAEQIAGAEPPGHRRPPNGGRPSVEEAEDALKAIATGGIVHAWRVAADTLERADASGVVSISAQESLDCRELTLLRNILDSGGWLLCVLEPPLCAAFAGAAVLWEWYLWYAGC